MLPDGTCDILGIWIESTEGAKFWMKVFNDLKTRGCNDMLIAVTDGLKAMAICGSTRSPAPMPTPGCSAFMAGRMKSRKR